MKMTTIPSLKMVSRASGELFTGHYKNLIIAFFYIILDTAQYSGIIAESAEVGNQVIRVIATDADSGSFGEITYTILMGNEVHIANN